MPRTQNQVLQDVRYRVDDENAGRYTDVKIRHWMNEIMHDIARRSEALRVSSEVDAVVDQVAYAVPAQTVRVHKITYQDADGYDHGDLDYVDIHNFQLKGIGYSRQAPQAYTTLGYPPSLTFQVHPAPDNLGVFTVHRYSMGTVLATNGDDGLENIDLPEGWIDVLVDGVEWKLCRADRDERWVEAKALYDENLGALIEASTRFVDGAGQMGMSYIAGGGFLESGSGWRW